MSLFSLHRYAPARRSRGLHGAIRTSTLSDDARSYLEACAVAGEYAVALLPAQSVYRSSELAEDLREAMHTREGRAQARRVATWAVLAEGYGAGGPGWEAGLSRARQVIGLGDREWPIVQDLARRSSADGGDGAGRLVRFSELSLDWLCEAASGRSLHPAGDTRFWLVNECARLYFAWRQVLLAALAERRRRMAPARRLRAFGR
jgi:hypothetical protein